MRSILKSMVILTSLIFILIGCGDDDPATPKTCESCETYQSCNTQTGLCDLKEGMCGTKADCSGDLICNDQNQCVEKPVFDCNSCDSSYQKCNSEQTACELLPGKCETKDHCEGSLLCGDDHTCYLPFQCETCLEHQQCNEDKTGCEPKAGRCDTEKDCDEGDLCDENHTCYTPFDCTICDTGYQQCNGDNTACELLAGRCLTKDDCDADQLCDQNHTCITQQTDTTIYPVQTGAVTAGSTTTVIGVVTAIQLDGDAIEGIYIQEPGVDYRGIFIYIITPGALTLNTGDQISVTGIYEEYNDLTEIKIETPAPVTILSNNQTAPDFTTIATADFGTEKLEPYESMVVKVQGDFTAGSTDSYGNTTITDGNSNQFIIRDSCFHFTLPEGEKLTGIRGVLTYNFGDFKILPRSSDDLIDHSTLCAAANCGDGELCRVENGVAGCICDETSGYYGEAGSCTTPCTPESCTESNKTVCTPVNATTFSCSCDPGFRDNEGVCEPIPSCDPLLYGDAFGKTGTALESALKTIISENHISYGYEPAKRAMFSHIDNEGGKIRGVYTGEYYNHPYDNNPETQTKTDETQFNCEHTWPQSMGISGTAKADLHHLFPTFSTVNSKRGNHPFGDVDGGESFGSGDYVSYLKNYVFEPADQHKGNVARAMLYMMIRYDNPAGFIDSNDQFNTFRVWHQSDPVDDAERTRNDVVESYQYNRNPFIDCPQFVDALYQ